MSKAGKTLILVGALIIGAGLLIGVALQISQAIGIRAATQQGMTVSGGAIGFVLNSFTGPLGALVVLVGFLLLHFSEVRKG